MTELAKESWAGMSGRELRDLCKTLRAEATTFEELFDRYVSRLWYFPRLLMNVACCPRSLAWQNGLGAHSEAVLRAFHRIFKLNKAGPIFRDHPDCIATGNVAIGYCYMLALPEGADGVGAPGLRYAATSVLQ